MRHRQQSTHRHICTHSRTQSRTRRVTCSQCLGVRRCSRESLLGQGHKGGLGNRGRSNLNCRDDLRWGGDRHSSTSSTSTSTSSSSSSTSTSTSSADPSPRTGSTLDAPRNVGQQWQAGGWLGATSHAHCRPCLLVPQSGSQLCVADQSVVSPSPEAPRAHADDHDQHNARGQTQAKCTEDATGARLTWAATVEAKRRATATKLAATCKRGSKMPLPAAPPPPYPSASPSASKHHRCM